MNYLVGDYLSEVTMGILARVKAKPSAGMGEGGYVREFVTDVCKPLLKDLVAKKIRVVTNAGGMNPKACKEEIEKLAASLGLNIIVAAVVGDDLLEQFSDLQQQGKIHPFGMEGENDILPQDKVMLSCNAYFGALPIKQALDQGAHIVVTGRCVDSALVLGPLMHEYGWTSADYDKLAAGSVAGHIIECGCQATGGNFTDWRDSAKNGWDNVGFPIAEIDFDGTTVISKAPNTGGLVSVGTVAEQLVYEIHDAANYVLPDVVVDFTQLKLEQVGKDRVRVTGVKGRAPTTLYKASLTYFEHYKLSGEIMIGGHEAAYKAEAVAKAIFTKTSRLLKRVGFKDFIQTHYELLGAESSYGANSRARDSREVILRLVATHNEPKALLLLAREFAPSATSMAPGITGSGSGRPRPIPIMAYRSCLVDRASVPITVLIGTKSSSMHDVPSTTGTIVSRPTTETPRVNIDGPAVKVPLRALCWGRSGDKGDVANIGLICRDKAYYPYVQAAVSAEAVRNYLPHILKGKVARYDLPGFYALNFVATRSLGGGGLSSLNTDRQGKCYAQQLLDYEIEVPRTLVPHAVSKLYLCVRCAGVAAATRAMSLTLV
jgi:hypothetical protein